MNRRVSNSIPHEPTTDPFGYVVQAVVAGVQLEKTSYATGMIDAAAEFIETDLQIGPPAPLIMHFHVHPEPYLEVSGEGWRFQVWRYTGRHMRAVRAGRVFTRAEAA